MKNGGFTMASPRIPSSITELVHSYLDDILKEDASFFKQLANKPQMNGRLFFNLVLDNGTSIAFPQNESTTALLMRANTSPIDELTNPRLTLTTVDIIQRNAADIFSMVRVSFLEKLTDLTPAEFDKLHHLLAGALCYKIWCQKNTNETDIVKAKIIAAVLSSTEDSSNTLHTLSTQYLQRLKSKFTDIHKNIDDYLNNNNIKLLLHTLGNLSNAMSDLQSNVEYRCLNEDDQHQIHRHINFKLNTLNINVTRRKLTKEDDASINKALAYIKPINTDGESHTSMHKGHSIETSTPATALENKKPSPRKQLTDANLSPRSAAAAVSVAKSPSGFMSRGSIIQPKKPAASPRVPSTPANSPRI